MEEKCFLCRIDVGEKRSNNQQELVELQANSFMLCQIIEMPNFGKEIHKFKEINYCRICSDRISGIRDMLNELQRLEKKVLDEKYVVEQQLKESYSNYQGNPSPGPFEVFRNEIITEVQSNSFQLLLKNIRDRKVLKEKPLRILKNIEIPKLIHTEEDEEPQNFAPFATESDTDLNDASNSSLINHQKSMGQSGRLRSEETVDDVVFSSDNEISVTHTSRPKVAEPGFEINELGLDSEEPSPSTSSFYDFQMTEVAEVKLFTQGEEYKSDASNSNNLGTAYGEINVEDPDFELSDNLNPDNFSEGDPEMTDSQMYVCAICEMSFEFYDQLEEHDKLHSTAQKAKALTTRAKQWKVRSSTSSTQNHAITIPSRRRIPVKCTECGKILSSSSTLSRHVRNVHQGVAKLHCPFCEFGSDLQSNMTTHILRRHSTERNFVCHLCPKTYKCQVDLNVHLKNHRQEPSTSFNVDYTYT